MNFRENMRTLLIISDEYSHNRISFDEYRLQRTQILNSLDEELNGVPAKQPDASPGEYKDESLLDKTLSFLKLDKIKEIN